MSDTRKTAIWPFAFEEVQVKTLRDEFAMAALTHINDSDYMSYKTTAESAYKLADEMLEARKKGSL
jgi:hypothetical protein